MIFSCSATWSDHRIPCSSVGERLWTWTWLVLCSGTEVHPLLDWTSFSSNGFPVELFSSLSVMRCLEELFNILILIAKQLIEKPLKRNNLQSGEDTNNLILLWPQLISPTFQLQIACTFRILAFPLIATWIEMLMINPVVSARYKQWIFICCKHYIDVLPKQTQFKYVYSHSSLFKSISTLASNMFLICQGRVQGENKCRLHPRQQ